MNEFFGENGQITESGAKFLQPLKSAVEKILASHEANLMSVAEIRAFGCVISKIMNDAISKTIQSRNELSTELNNISDDKIDFYFKNKYGDDWILSPLLLKEEQDLVSKFFEKKLKDLVEFETGKIPHHACPGIKTLPGFGPKYK